MNIYFINNDVEHFYVLKNKICLGDDLKIEINHLKNISLCTSSLKDRFFLCVNRGDVYISDTIKYIENINVLLTKNKKAITEYEKYGFILPPFTHYNEIKIITPYKKFIISKSQISVFDELPIFSKKNNFELSLNNFFDKFKNNNFDILVSGGIDSSALLGFLNNKKRINKAFMCKMSTLSAETNKAKRICSSIEIPLMVIDLDKDLTQTADYFYEYTGELISDSISIVMMEIFKEISDKNKMVYLVDGQGADSLLNGLPLNKIFDLWCKLKPIRFLISPFTNITIFNNKKTKIGRKLYRLTKALKCLSQASFDKSIIVALTENCCNSNDVDGRLIKRIDDLYNKYEDWHMVLRILYLFDILPVREMQKYIFAKKLNINVVTPFLDKDLLEELLSLDNNVSIKNGVYKYPIKNMASTFWPDEFKNSSTSPFQVEYSILGDDIKKFSMQKLNL